MASFMEAALSFFKTTTSTISVVVLTLLILLSVSSTFEVNKNVYNKTWIFRWYRGAYVTYDMCFSKL